MPDRAGLPIRAAFDAIRRLDADALIAVIHPDVRFESRITAVEDATYEGHDGVHRYIDNLAEAFERVGMELSGLVSDDQRAVFENRFSGRGRGSGIEVEHCFHVAARGHGGKLVWWGFFDSRAQALAAVGIDDEQRPSGADASRVYLLGHTERELERLAVQARLIDPITRRLFEAAGISRGMRVLDVGSGAGDVAFLAAAVVGEAGEVVGVDRSEAALELARQRAADARLTNVNFVVGDPGELEFEQPFDAVVGRYVLMFQPDPVEMLRRIVARVRPGGVVAFHEPDWGGVRSSPRAPLFEEWCARMVEAFSLRGSDPYMGTRLHATFVAAGLAPPALRAEDLTGGAAQAADVIEVHTDLAVTLLADMESLGLVKPGEFAAESLGREVLDEVIANDSVVVGRTEFGAWSVLPE